MELQQLRYFMEIAKTENISLAAKQLYIAQPSLSQTLKRLESEMGMPLFDRVGKKVILNDAGKIFLKHVKTVFSALDNAERELKTYSSDTLTNVCICAQSASLLLPDIVVRIQSKHPNIHLQLLQQTDVADMPWDLKIYSDIECPKHKPFIKLMDEPIGIAMPKDHHLASKPIITRQDLEGESFVSLSARHNLFTEVSHYCDLYDWHPTISTYIDSPNVMRDLLKINLGVAFIPKYTWKYFYGDSIVFRTVSDMPMTRSMILSWEESRYMTPATQKCKDIIIDYFNEYLLAF